MTPRLSTTCLALALGTLLLAPPIPAQLLVAPSSDLPLPVHAVRALDLARAIAEPAPGLAGAIAAAKLAQRHRAADLGIDWEPRPSSDSPPSAAASARALLALFQREATPEEEAAIATLDDAAPALGAALGRAIDGYLRYADAVAAIDDPSDPTARAQFYAAREGLLDAALALRDALAVAPQTANVPPVDIPPVLSIDLVARSNTYAKNYALLIDAGGEDTYTNNAGGVFSHASVSVSAAAFDFGAARDLFVSSARAANGGASPAPGCIACKPTAGFLLDDGGNDRYKSAGSGGNGGGADLGFGFLLDAGGDDVYIAQGHGTNGGGAYLGEGFLFDDWGDDVYQAGDTGTNGGGAQGGRGLLVDRVGDDRYTAGSDGTNGGAASAYLGAATAFGLLVDADGDDVYRGGWRGVNGGAWSSTWSSTARGALVESWGNDVYEAKDPADSNGLGARGGMGLLSDAYGTDRFEAGASVCANPASACTQYIIAIPGPSLRLDQEVVR